MKRFVKVKELLHSDVAKVLSIDNTVKDSIVWKNLLSLEVRLSFLRLILGAPIIVNSGYRCERLNREVKGSPTSLHMKGLAADIRTTAEKNEYLRTLVLDESVRKMLLIREVIQHDTYVHIGFYPCESLSKEE